MDNFAPALNLATHLASLCYYSDVTSAINWAFLPIGDKSRISVRLVHEESRDKEYLSTMDFDDHTPEEMTEVGSDELLSDDDLRLPEGANPLVRLHAIRAWLTRRQKMANLEIGKAALELQQLQQDKSGTARLRRRELQARQEQIQQLQEAFQQAQQRLATYEKTETLLQECVDHTTVGERLLVEYYLMLEEQVQNSLQAGESETSLHLQVLQDVQHRVEQVSISNEEE